MGKRCHACVTVRAHGRVPIFWHSLAYMTTQLWRAGLSMFMGMFPAITLVTGRR